jgi:hypothetical protein
MNKDKITYTEKEAKKSIHRQKKERNLAVFAMREYGIPSRQIAREYNISCERVRQICEYVVAHQEHSYEHAADYLYGSILSNLRAIARSYINLSLLVPNTEQKLELDDGGRPPLDRL